MLGFSSLTGIGAVVFGLILLAYGLRVADPQYRLRIVAYAVLIGPATAIWPWCWYSVLSPIKTTNVAFVPLAIFAFLGLPLVLPLAIRFADSKLRTKSTLERRGAGFTVYGSLVVAFALAYILTTTQPEYEKYFHVVSLSAFISLGGFIGIGYLGPTASSNAQSVAAVSSKQLSSPVRDYMVNARRESEQIVMRDVDDAMSDAIDRVQRLGGTQMAGFISDVSTFMSVARRVPYITLSGSKIESRIGTDFVGVGGRSQRGKGGIIVVTGGNLSADEARTVAKLLADNAEEVVFTSPHLQVPADISTRADFS